MHEHARLKKTLALRAQAKSNSYLGLFQGCVLSCILFNCVFQLLLNLVARLSNANGYKFKEIPIVLHDQAFADDISITSSNPELAQQSIDAIVRFLDWYLLQANPKKCITMAAKKFDPRNVHQVDFERHGDTVYCPYDPNLTIKGAKLRFIVDVAADLRRSSMTTSKSSVASSVLT